MRKKHYFTSKIEIKPQRISNSPNQFRDYFTSKIEIKPQPAVCTLKTRINYFTSKIEIKPQPSQSASECGTIILHQR